MWNGLRIESEKDKDMNSLGEKIMMVFALVVGAAAGLGLLVTFAQMIWSMFKNRKK